MFLLRNFFQIGGIILTLGSAYGSTALRKKLGFFSAITPESSTSFRCRLSTFLKPMGTSPLNSSTFVEPGIRHFGPFQVHLPIMLLDERLNSRNLTFIQLPFFSTQTGTFKTQKPLFPLCVLSAQGELIDKTKHHIAL